MELLNGNTFDETIEPKSGDESPIHFKHPTKIPELSK